MPESRSPTILFIGGGNMAAAMIGGLVGSTGDTRVAVIEPQAATRAELERRFGVATHAAAIDGIRADAIVLAVKPQVAATALAAARPLLSANAGAVLVSIAAGTPIAAIREASGGHPSIVRAMPNTPALIGEGVTGLYVPAGIAAPLAALAERIVASTGAVVRLDDEGALDAVTAVSGSGPAYVFYLIEGMMRAAHAQGLSAAQARTLVHATVRGAALLAAASDEPAEVLRQRVTSPNGTTAAAIAELDRQGVMDAIVSAIAAARRRSEELGRG